MAKTPQTRSSLVRPSYAWLSLALVALLFVAVNVYSSVTFTSARLDLTEDRLYTLSSGTRETLSKIEEPITLRFFFSERLGRELPAYAAYGQRVRNLLQEYANLAGGKIQLEIFDPEPFSTVEDRAVSFGLQGVPIDQSGEQVYFGLVGTNLTDDEQVIPFFQPERERFLEYDLTRIVNNLANPERKVVGMIAGLPLEGRFMPGGQVAPPWTILQQMRQVFQVRTIGTAIDRVAPDVDVLFVVHPKNLPEKTLYAIDQFMMAGGRAIFFVDPYSEADATIPDPSGQPKLDTASALPALFDKWGVTVSQGEVVGDRRAARRVNAGAGSQVVPVDFVVWLNLQRGNINQDLPVTGELQRLSMASAGAVGLAEGAGLTMTPLITTSPESMMIPVDRLRPRPDPQGLLREYKPGGEAKVLAARFQGRLATAFPDGRPVPEGETPGDAGAPKELPEFRTESQGEAMFAVIADTDLLDDRFWVQVQDFFGQQVVTPFANNGDFVMNLLESLSGSSALVDLRGRGMIARPFTVIEEMRREADQRFRAQEEALQERLQASLARLEELRSKDAPGGGAILTNAQRAEIAKIQEDILEARRELRTVQRSLREDIDALQTRLLFLNIGLVPLLVVLAAILVGLARAARRRRGAISATPSGKGASA
ncbi:GldG family protein [Oceanibaculum indicum]|uniref:Gliding motility ABC transporter auxiliary component-like protein n=1 Tax=Oceanibaculum indicum P24 TaxID=1207063 RepID=K2JHS5_9PROT|nr:Gldg family protein [Oceanibaculum indicum]EKE70174.1 gliding motility ABC transporter auxiliary component-like protein [Oceanibaculum indicum P24]